MSGVNFEDYCDSIENNNNFFTIFEKTNLLNLTLLKMIIPTFFINANFNPKWFNSKNVKI